MYLKSSIENIVLKRLILVLMISLTVLLAVLAFIDFFTATNFAEGITGGSPSIDTSQIKLEDNRENDFVSSPLDIPIQGVFPKLSFLYSYRC